jgi:hypothetical protein
MARRSAWYSAGALAAAMWAAGVAVAADIGGWYAEQQKVAALAGSSSDSPSCPQAVVRANAEPTAVRTYQAAHCYLQGDAPDLVAARAWLTRSADMNFMPAHRLLRALAIAESGAHASQRHCHDLGEARQLCHGGMPMEQTVPNQ